MSALHNLILLSAIQVTTVASVAWALCRFAPSRSSTTRSAVTGVAATLILVLTVVAFVPLPKCLHWSVAYRGNPVAKTSRANLDETQPSRRPSPVSQTAPDRDRTGETGLIAFVLRGMAQAFKPFSSPEIVQRDRWLTVPLFCVAFIVAVFVLRHLLGLVTISSLRRASRAIDEPEIQKLLARLRDRLACQAAEIRESAELTSAATFGWFHPVILLPAAWRQWTTAELRAVLAHELAHVKRRDFHVRFLGCLCASLHFYHPLVKWLLRRMVVEQELAADALAATAAGGPSGYLRALSRLALRQDQPAAELAIVPTYPGYLPVSSSFLMRRIEMLRAKDGSNNPERGKSARWAAIFMLVVVTVAVAGLRTSAQRSDGDAPPTTRQAKNENVEKTGAVRVANSKKTASESLFQHDRFDPSQLPFAENGAVVIRVSALLDRPEMRPYADIFRTQWNSLCKQFCKSDVAPIQPDDIEFIAAGLTVSLKEDRIMFGTGLVLVRFRTASDWKVRVKKLFPTAEQQNGPAGTYLKLPVIPALGPGHLVVRPLDERSIVMGAAGAVADWVVANDRLPKEPKEWDSHWKHVDRGVITLLIDNDSVTWTAVPKAKRDEFPEINSLTKQVRFLAIGVDWGATSSQAQIRSRITGKNQDSAIAMKQSVEKLVEFAESFLLNAAEKAPKAHPEADWFRRLAQMLDSAVVQVDREPNGEEHLSIQATTRFNVADVLGRAAAGKPVRR